MNTTAIIVSTAIVSLTFSLNAMAHSPSKEECVEAGDFIRNAALSRENGMDRTTFITKITDDFALIKSFPAELRWFVQDTDDEEFLLKAATEVFEHPTEPDIHQRNFLSACIIRISQLKITVDMIGPLGMKNPGNEQ